MKKIISFMIILVLIPLCFANTDIDIQIETEQNITSNIIQIAEGNINTSLYCNGKTCETNIYSGKINIPENQSFNYNDYTTLNVDKKGFSFNNFIRQISEKINPFINGQEPTHKSNAWKFLEMMDYLFVRKNDVKPIFNNIEYLVSQLDTLQAKVTLLEQHTNITYDAKKLECLTAINQAKRINQRINTKSGMVVDLDSFGEVCVEFTSTKSDLLITKRK